MNTRLTRTHPSREPAFSSGGWTIRGESFGNCAGVCRLPDEVAHRPVRFRSHSRILDEPLNGCRHSIRYQGKTWLNPPPPFTAETQIIDSTGASKRPEPRSVSPVPAVCVRQSGTRLGWMGDGWEGPRLACRSPPSARRRLSPRRSVNASAPSVC